jgi:hypothetical protein
MGASIYNMNDLFHWELDWCQFYKFSKYHHCSNVLSCNLSDKMCMVHHAFR